MRILSFILASLFLAACAFEAEAKAWRGIVPLHSKRTDVIKIFGEPYWIVPDAISYKLATENVTFFFLDASNADACGNRFTVETVLRIQVSPTEPMRMSELGLDEKRVRTFDASLPPDTDLRGYVDEQEGLIAGAKNGHVYAIFYVPSNEDWRICPASQERLESFVTTNSCSCPTLRVESSETVTVGQLATFTAEVGVTLSAIAYRWTVSNGRIIRGQGTDTLVVDTFGLEGKTLKGTVEIGPLPHCPNSASNETKIIKP